MIHELKQMVDEKQSAIFKKYGVFFAFSDEQFEKNKTPLEDGDKYVRLFGGGFCPKSKAKEMIQALEDAHKWYQEQINSGKLREEHILYELNNHEAFYTGEIGDTLEALGDDYTAEEVFEVFKANRNAAYK
jgi:hypothetical protein